MPIQRGSASRSRPIAATVNYIDENVPPPWKISLFADDLALWTSTTTIDQAEEEINAISHR